MKNSTNDYENWLIKVAKDIDHKYLNVVLYCFKQFLLFSENTDKNAKSIVKDHTMYFAGGTLCLDLDFLKKKVIILINASTETYEIIVNGESISTRLCSLPMLKYYMEIYELSKGKTVYLDEVIDNTVLKYYKPIKRLLPKTNLFETW